MISYDSAIGAYPCAAGRQGQIEYAVRMSERGNPIKENEWGVWDVGHGNYLGNRA